MEPMTSRTMCYRCYRPSQGGCFCDEVTSFNTNFEFRILMHPKEAKKSHVGTGRMANVALDNCKIIIDPTFDQNVEVQNLIQSEEYFPMLLYPGTDAINLSEDELPVSRFEGKKPLVFIIDGTWPCAKAMMRDSLTLHKLPRISFDSSLISKYSIRHQPASYCLSTIESIYQVLLNLERQGLEDLGGKKEVLPELLEKMVEFQKECASDPNRHNYRRGGNSSPYKTQSDRRPSKKWEGRRICFEAQNYH